MCAGKTHEDSSQMAQAKQQFEVRQEWARLFKDFNYRTLDSWSCERRVVGKAEYLSKGENPRFIVTSLDKEQYRARALYEEFYCARGDTVKCCVQHLRLYVFSKLMLPCFYKIS